MDVQAVLRRLEAMQGEKAAVALLCYEVPPFSIAAPVEGSPGGRHHESNYCHRRIAASALERELGVEIPEFLPAGQAIGDTVPTGASIADWRDLVAGAGGR
jgi:hypothetical protein